MVRRVEAGMPQAHGAVQMGHCGARPRRGCIVISLRVRRVWPILTLTGHRGHPVKLRAGLSASGQHEARAGVFWGAYGDAGVDGVADLVP